MPLTEARENPVETTVERKDCVDLQFAGNHDLRPVHHAEELVLMAAERIPRRRQLPRRDVLKRNHLPLPGPHLDKLTHPFGGGMTMSACECNRHRFEKHDTRRVRDTMFPAEDLTEEFGRTVVVRIPQVLERDEEGGIDEEAHRRPPP